MTHILFLWATVAVLHTSSGFPIGKERDWRPLGEFRTQADCTRAAAQLGLEAKNFRCVSTGKPS